MVLTDLGKVVCCIGILLMLLHAGHCAEVENLMHFSENSRGYLKNHWTNTNVVMKNVLLNI